MGGVTLSNAFPELVKDGGCGEFDLRKVPNDEQGMSPLAIWCNESERMMAVMPADLPRFEAICQRERCPYAVVGTATKEQHSSMIRADKPVDLPMSVLFGKPPKVHHG